MTKHATAKHLRDCLNAISENNNLIQGGIDICPCGYVYDPELGDPDNGIAPGTAWEDIPDDWVCPVCRLDKSAFEEE